ncbi:hypothetical protein KQX54_000263 [Cotesia glomerata]|uniref:Uncharacterized protein n=1 Tax=Cotesia glomerata TaxID=32391 RepID=A0AAV7I6Z7_COTGL|nr:hypothetical protein KQX54_000263 [Cotesia glomerata]
MVGEIIVDVQGFKRLTIVLGERACNLPDKYKHTNLWLINKFHGLSWVSGSITYDIVEDVLNIIVRDYQCIYVKGCEKQKWVKSFCSTTKQVIDLESLGCPSINKLPNILKREQHQGSEHSDILYDDYHCAMENVHD